MDAAEIEHERQMYLKLNYSIRSIKDVYDHDLVTETKMFNTALERISKLPIRTEKEIAQWELNWLKMMSILKAVKK